MRNTVTKAPTIISVQPGPSYFGCVSGPLNFDSSATSPSEVDFRKVDPATYWAPLNTFNLRWIIGVQPSGNLPYPNFVGWVYPFGGWRVNYVGGWPGTLDATFNIFADLTSPQQPGELLLPPSLPASVDSPYNTSMIHYFTNQAYLECLEKIPAGVPACVNGGTTNCYDSQNSIPSSIPWSVVWSSSSISTPYYSGPALLANYIEGTLQENWFFAPKIGPVYIQGVAEGKGNTDVSLELVNYSAGNGSTAASPDVYLSDALAAQAGTATGSLDFDQWGALFTAATNVVAPTSPDACVSPFDYSNLSLQQYLACLEGIDSTCHATRYKPSNIETIVSQMDVLAKQEDPAYPNLNWDQWSFWYAKATGVAAPAPETRCQLHSIKLGGTTCVISNRWLRLTLRQWLLIFEKYHGCAIPENSCS
jgi:hypothetical protein